MFLKILVLSTLISLTNLNSAESSCQPINNKYIRSINHEEGIYVVKAVKGNSKFNRAWQRTEICKWFSAIEETANLIPEHFITVIEPVSFDFVINNTEWFTALAGSPILINLKPGLKPDWMTWESFVNKGFSREEMIYVVLHEMAHLFSFKQGSNTFFNESQTTLYGQKMGGEEDFAESVAIYVMWTEYLKQNFTIHYEIIKTIFGKEFTPYRCMPRSIKTKLTKPFKAKVC